MARQYTKVDVVCQISDNFKKEKSKTDKFYFKIPEFTKSLIFFWESEDIKLIEESGVSAGDSFICDIVEQKRGQYTNYYGYNPRNFKKRLQNSVRIPAGPEPTPPVTEAKFQNAMDMRNANKELIIIDQDIEWIRSQVANYPDGAVKGHYQNMVAAKLQYLATIESNLHLNDLLKAITILTNAVTELTDKVESIEKDILMKEVA